MNSSTMKNVAFTLVVAAALLTFTDSAFAVGAAGAKVKTFTTDIITVLSAIGIAIATIAVFIFGYQVSFGGKRPQEAAPILVGGLLIGGAAQFGAWIAA